MPNVSRKKRCFARKNHEINVMLHTGTRFVEIAKTVGEATVTRCEVQSSVSKAIDEPSDHESREQGRVYELVMPKGSSHLP